MNETYDKKAFAHYLGGLILMTAALWVTKGVAFCVLGPLMLLMGMKNPINLLYYLMMAIAMMMCNTKLVPKTMLFALTQRGLMFVVAFALATQIFGRRKSQLIAPLWGILVYLVYMILPSVLGWNFTISGLKLILFTSVFLAYFGVANWVILHPTVRVAQVRSIFLAFTAFFIFGSVLLIPFPGISLMNFYELSSTQLAEMVSLFMGMTMHSQALGPIVVILSVTLFADAVFSLKRFDKLYVSILLAAPVLIYKTSSRTAMGGFFLSIFVVGLILLRARGVTIQWRSKITGMCAGLVVLLTAIILIVPSFQQRAVQYILKFDKDAQASDITVENVTATRMGRVEESMWEFKQSPVIGNGFQVSSEYARLKNARWDQLLSAPVEKGVWVTAVLEEGGVVGLVIFGAFVLVVVVQMLKRGAYTALSAFITMLILNLGEMTMFSMTSTGGLTWAVVFIAAMLDAQRLKAKQIPGAFPRMPMDQILPQSGGWRSGMGSLPGWGRR